MLVDTIKELVLLDLLVGILRFVGDITSAASIAAWSYFHEKLKNN